MVHQEDYVSYEQAKTLKELGFDWKCYTFYHLDNWCGLSSSGMYENHNMFKMCFSAPTLAQAQKWLREKGIIVLVGYEPYKYWLIENNGPKWKYYINSKDSIHHSMAEFNSYEQSLSEGIDKALKLMKK